MSKILEVILGVTLTVATYGLFGGWALMLFFGVLHNDFIDVAPTPGYWGSVLVVGSAYVLGRVVATALNPAKKDDE